MQALWVAACPDEADEFFDFMAGAAAGSPTRPAAADHVRHRRRARPLRTRRCRHLSGWRDSAPGPGRQRRLDQPQLDVYGELLDAAARLARPAGELSGATRDFLVGLADAAAARWHQPDDGIWEVRGEPRHFLHSKLMCWVALDRAVALAGPARRDDHVDGVDGRRARRSGPPIEHRRLERGAGVVHAVLRQPPTSTPPSCCCPSSGFLPRRRPAGALHDRRRREPAHRRARTGLPLPHRLRRGRPRRRGRHLPAVHLLARPRPRPGRPGRARPREVFERAAGYVNDVGLLAEEVDPATGELLGNFPQAFSHIGLVNAAWAIPRPSGTTRPSRSEPWTGPSTGSCCRSA